MNYILQENVFREPQYDALEKALIDLKLPYQIVRFFPFVDKVVLLSDIPGSNFNVDDLPEFSPETDKVFCFGSIKLSRIARDKGWNLGTMMNSNHDFMVYKEHYGDNLLNYDSVIHKLTNDFNWKDNEIKFIRPTEDTKSFNGRVFTQEEWYQTLEHYLHNYRSDVFNEDTLVQASPPKNIYIEVRFWVVNGRIVSGSTYRVNNKTDFYPIESELFAQSMVDKYQLAEAFVIDVCHTADGWKIVECGCINCAGFYKADMKKIVSSVEEYFNPKI